MEPLAVLCLVAYLFFFSKRAPRYLHVFQQEEYDGGRFLPWLIRTRAFDRRLSSVLLVLSFAAAFADGYWPVWIKPTIAATILIAISFLEPNPRLEAKKKLVMTQRATRIYVLAFLLGSLVGIAALAYGTVFGLIIAVQMIPLTIVVANILLKPVEYYVQKRILQKARDRLNQINPQVIGITGSFGKTSVKHILGHILELNAPTLFTPGSINTLMGISRIIREKLHKDCRYFIVEMGAYGQGSIRKLCNLTPPKAGLIISLGEAHYERFKTLDAVAHAKFELAEAVLANGQGPLIVHEDVLTQDYARTFVTEHRERFILCGSSEQADVRILSSAQSAAGLVIQISFKGQMVTLTAPLYGLQHADNVVLAFAAATALGITPERASAALRSVPQIQHRMEVKPQPDGTYYIDDAFNSNPRGFLSAIELLDKLATEHGGKRILITPGVAELGSKHNEVHRKLGMESAKRADVAIVVRADRIPTFVQGFRAAGTSSRCETVGSLNEALDWLKLNAKPNDVYLIENDLPDLYEKRLRL